MLRRIVPLILSYVLFFGIYSLLYTVLLPFFSYGQAAAMVAFVSAVLAAAVALVTTEKGLGISVNRQSVGTGKRARGKCILLGFWGLFTGNCVLSLLISPSDVTDYSIVGFILQILSAVIIHPIGEEILFRRLFLPRIGEYLPGPAALAVQAILFALTHYFSGAGNMLYALLGGFILGAVYLHTGKLMYTIFLQAAVNLIGLFLPVGILPAVCAVSAGALIISFMIYKLLTNRKESGS